MDFYSRYDDLCRKQGIDPCSQKTAETLGTTRANISNWKKGTKPSLERVRAMADLLHTTADYLLGRTDDPTDIISEAKNKKEDQPLPKGLVDLLRKLDSSDIEKTIAYAQGLLSADKYQKSTGLSNERAM